MSGGAPSAPARTSGDLSRGRAGARVQPEDTWRTGAGLAWFPLTGTKMISSRLLGDRVVGDAVSREV